MAILQVENGRSNPRGPVTGGYNNITIGPFTGTPGAVTTTWRIPLPQNVRLMGVNVANISSAGGASRPTFQMTDGTNNMLSGNATVVTADNVAISPTSSPSLVAAYRNQSKGTQLRFALTTVASEVVTGLVIVLTFKVRGHVVALAKND